MTGTGTDQMHGLGPLSPLLPAVQEAGRIAMAIYARDVDVASKPDGSPVTEADIAVNDVLCEALEHQFPGIAIVTEERVKTHVALAPGKPFFLVDPIDGTKEFIARTGEFTINVALVENGLPVAGIVSAPAMGRLFVGAQGDGAFEIAESGTVLRLGVRTCPDAMTAVASRSHGTPETEAFLADLGVTDRVSAGSSLKFCLLAAGEADVYPRFGPTMEWDTAAGQAVLAAAGGLVYAASGEPLAYGKPSYRNPHFIACSPGAARRCGLAAA